MRWVFEINFECIINDGIWDNDYELFYTNRLKRITRKLSNFIIKQELIPENLEKYEDIEEPEEIEN